MSTFTSKLVAALYNRRPQTPISQRQTPASDEIAGGNDERAAEQRGDSNAVIEERYPHKLAAHERLYNLSSFRIQTHAIKMPLLGSRKRGGKAEVAQATFQRRIWSNKKQVAVKKFAYYREIDRHRFSNEFTHEVELMAGLSHKNIVQLIGFIEDFEAGQAWIVMSWEPNGNVREFLATGKWEIPERISLIQDTFEGLKYLHTRHPPICHGDLKSLNILVNSSYRAVITDFGSARAIKESAENERDAGTSRGEPTPKDDCSRIQVVASGNQLTLTGPAWSLRWAPPEVVNGDHPSLLSDTWSASWVCWEIMTDELPFSELDSGTAITLKVVQGNVPCSRDNERLSQIVRLCSMMTECWALDPRDRPSISRCCDEVKWMPSLPPLGGVRLNSKVATTRLLLQMGRMHYERSRFDDAVSVFQEVLHVVTSKEDQNKTAEAYYWLGNTFINQIKFDKAEESYTRARDTYASIGDDRGEAHALRGLGEVYRHQSKLLEAESCFIEAGAIYESIGDDQGQASTMCGLGHIYQTTSYYYTKAEGSFIKAQEIYACIADEQGRANALFGLGTVYYLQSKFAEAEELLSRVHSIYARIGDDLGQANALLGLGKTHCARPGHAAAEPLRTQALETDARIGGQADAMSPLGDVHVLQSKYTKAESSYQQALDIYTRIGKNGAQAEALFGLGEVYRYQSQYILAESAYQKALDIETRIRNHMAMAEVLSGLGEVYLHQAQYTEAALCYQQALEIYVRIGYSGTQAKAWYGLGEVHRHQSEYPEAELAYQEALGVYAAIGDYGAEAKALYGLGEVYRHQSKYTEAESCYRRAIDSCQCTGDDDGRQKALSCLRLVLTLRMDLVPGGSSCGTK